MKSLFLMRHAKSSWGVAGLDDVDRPLNERGRAAGARMAQYFSTEGIQPELILCSPAVRARETMALVFPDATQSVNIVDDLYAAGQLEVLELLRATEPEIPSVLVLGHNPTMQKLALMLATLEDGPHDRVANKFPTCALVRLDFDGEWRGLQPESARIVSFVAPKDLD